MRRPQAYRPERPTPFETIVALAGLVIAAAIVGFMVWVTWVAIATWIDTVTDGLRSALP